MAEWVVDYFFNFQIDYHLAFLTPLIFCAYLIHPNIEKHKEKRSQGVNFSSILFRLDNFLKIKIKDSSVKEYLVRYIPSFIFVVLLLIFNLNFWTLIPFVIGIMFFELFRFLFYKFSK